MPGVSVTALSSDGASYSGFATTGLDGSYKIESGLGAGTYMVTAYSGTSFDQIQNVIVTVGHETPNIDLTLNVVVQPSGAISGLVTDANNKPIAGATVSAGSSQDTSDSQGAYMISSGLPTGTYTVYVSATGYQQQNRTGISVTTGSTTSGINFKLVKSPATQSGRISGTVTGEDNPLTNKQPSSITCIPSQTSINVGTTLSISGGVTPPVVGASINIEYKMGSTDVSRSATTGSDGKYSDSYAPTAAGSWTVQASWEGNTQYTGASSDDSSIHGNATHSYYGRSQDHCPRQQRQTHSRGNGIFDHNAKWTGYTQRCLRVGRIYILLGCHRGLLHIPSCDDGIPD